MSRTSSDNSFVFAIFTNVATRYVQNCDERHDGPNPIKTVISDREEPWDALIS